MYIHIKNLIIALDNVKCHEKIFLTKKIFQRVRVSAQRVHAGPQPQQDQGQQGGQDGGPGRHHRHQQVRGVWTTLRKILLLTIFCNIV